MQIQQTCAVLLIVLNCRSSVIVPSPGYYRRRSWKLQRSPELFVHTKISNRRWNVPLPAACSGLLPCRAVAEMCVCRISIFVVLAFAMEVVQCEMGLT
jgi:hypothetical protein